MIIFNHLYKKDKNIPLKRYLEVSEIIEYDHYRLPMILFEIVELLREKY